jgi:hypothetical protein
VSPGFFQGVDNAAKVGYDGTVILDDGWADGGEDLEITIKGERHPLESGAIPGR